MFLIDLEFEAVRPIHSLPPWHGARWSAWFRNVANLAGLRFENFVEAILPFRQGVAPIKNGELLTVRLALAAGGAFLLPGFLAALPYAESEGQFSSLSLAFVQARDAVGKNVVWRAGRGAEKPPEKFSPDFVGAEVAALTEVSEWSLRFLGPLRLPLPPGHHARGKEVGKFARPEDLATTAGLGNLLGRIRFLPDETFSWPKTSLVSSSLRWEDMRYNASRQMAIGGVTGQMSWRGYLDPAQAWRLVLGQYLGAGKSGRFGLGFWRIPELDRVRAIDL